MARVLVVHPPVSVAKDFIDYPYFADLGAVQLAAVLRERGHAVTLVDAYALPGSSLEWRADGRAHLGAPVDEVLEAAAGAGEIDAAVVAYTPFHRPPHRDDVLGALLAGLRATHPEARLLLADCYQSGQHYVEAPGEAVLSAYREVDAWVKYEAEVTVPALIAGEAAPSGAHPGESPKLDELPSPAWDLVDLGAHDRFRARVIDNLGRGRWAFPIDGRTLPVVTSRGCPFRCVHCSSNPGRGPGEPKTQRRYSPERLRAHLETLVRRHGASRVEVLDELINVNERHFDDFLDEVAALDVHFDIPNGMRADYLEPRHLARMAGRVTTVSVSAESGVQRVVTEVVGKQLDLDAIVRAADGAHRAGVPLMIHYMIGLPGETAREMNDTLEFAFELWDRFRAWPAVQFATPLPGTRLAEGRPLPVVEDWGPHFQKAPSQPDATVSAETLRKMRWTYEQRMGAAQATQKLVVDVTYVCNNRCTFCAVGSLHRDGHRTQKREHLAEHRRHGVRMVDFDGGEPTLDPELIPLVRYARAIGYERVAVTTNGRMCAYDDFARKLVRSGLTTLLFSVHGPDARSHAREVGVPEAFEQTIGGIENCLAHAPEGVELGMNITITEGNHERLGEVAELCWDLGLRWLNLQFLTPFGRATRRVAPDTQRAADIATGVIDEWQDRMKLQVLNLPFCFVPGYERFVVGDMQTIAGHTILVKDDDVSLGDYLAERRVRRPVCEPCPHRSFCGGFYELEDVPDPPWLVTPESLVRPIDPDLAAR